MGARETEKEKRKSKLQERENGPFVLVNGRALWEKTESRINAFGRDSKERTGRGGKGRGKRRVGH